MQKARSVFGGREILREVPISPARRRAWRAPTREGAKVLLGRGLKPRAEGSR